MCLGLVELLGHRGEWVGGWVGGWGMGGCVFRSVGGVGGGVEPQGLLGPRGWLGNG